jgi:hypothetical protein
MFRLLDNTNNKENIIRIQGKQTTRSAPISTLMFQNYDEDTKRVIDMMAVSCYDSDNNTSNNSFGDFVVRTRDPTSCNLTERLRVAYNGAVQIGQNASSNALLNINGDLLVQSNISANDINVGTLRAQTIFTTQTIHTTQTITAQDSQTIQTLYTRKLVITRGVPASSNNSNSSDSIYYFKDWSSYEPSISNAYISNVILQRADHRILNKNIDLDVAFSFSLLNNELSNLSMLAPIGESRNTVKKQYTLYDVSNETYFTDNMLMISSSNIELSLSNLQASNYEISFSTSYRLP